MVMRATTPKDQKVRLAMLLAEEFDPLVEFVVPVPDCVGDVVKEVPAPAPVKDGGAKPILLPDL